jgi:hypothetical protein
LDTRTKHTIAQDRLVVAEQRILDAERRKSATNLQLLAFEQKQLEKRLSTIYNYSNSAFANRPLKMRGRSTSEVIFRNIRRSSSWNEALPIIRSKLSISLHDSNQNLLSLPKIDDSNRRLSTFSDGDVSDNTFLSSDIESGEERENEIKKIPKSISKTTNSKKITTKKKILPKIISKQSKSLPPTVAIIPPDEDLLFLSQ